MNEERVKKNVGVIEKHMQEVLTECPEILDVVIALNWDRDEIKDDELQVPASMSFTSRKDNSEVHVQAVQLARILSDTALSMHERVIQAFLEANATLAEDLGKAQGRAKPPTDN